MQIDGQNECNQEKTGWQAFNEATRYYIIGIGLVLSLGTLALWVGEENNMPILVLNAMIGAILIFLGLFSQTPANN